LTSNDIPRKVRKDQYPYDGRHKEVTLGIDRRLAVGIQQKSYIDRYQSFHDEPQRCVQVFYFAWQIALHGLVSGHDPNPKDKFQQGGNDQSQQSISDIHGYSLIFCATATIIILFFPPSKNRIKNNGFYFNHSLKNDEIIPLRLCQLRQFRDLLAYDLRLVGLLYLRVYLPYYPDGQYGHLPVRL
jgi:hypothetical protein